MTSPHAHPARRLVSLLLTACLIVGACSLSDGLMAKPARRIATMLAQPDGTTIAAIYVGDERGDTYIDRASGLPLVQDADGYWRLGKNDTDTQVWASASASTAARGQADADALPLDGMGVTSQADNDARPQGRQSSPGQTVRGRTRAGLNPTLGRHHLPCLLVSFSDLDFSSVWQSQGAGRYADIRALYEDMLGGSNYTMGEAIGSVAQYFHAQSYGQYEMVFDIIGPVRISESCTSGGDRNYQQARAEWAAALDSAYQQGLITREMIDRWDNDGNGLVDMLYVFYAGYSASETGGDTQLPAGDTLWTEAKSQPKFNVNQHYIWPHQWVLSPGVSYDGSAQFYKYACSSELMGASSIVYAHSDSVRTTSGTDIGDRAPALASSETWRHCYVIDSIRPNPVLTFDGIGSCTHEFGHALGLPDFYCTTSADGIYGMATWSNMDQGCYNDRGHCPPSYTVHERMMLGWVTPAELPDTGTVRLRPFDCTPDCYILRNPANPDEYLTFENHQWQGWDRYYGFGSYTWPYYTSASARFTDTHGLLITHVMYDALAWSSNTVNVTPGRERCNPMPADGTLDPYVDIIDRTGLDRFRHSLRGDIFPGYQAQTSASTETNPYMRWYTEPGRTLTDTIDLVISDITEHADDGSLTFRVTRPSLTASGISTLEADRSTATAGQTPRLILTGGRLVIERHGRRYSLDGAVVTQPTAPRFDAQATGLAAPTGPSTAHRP